MSADELRLAKQWQAQKKSVSDIARLLGRDKGTISRRLGRAKTKQRPSGRQPALTKAQVDRLECKARSMIKVADACYQVTVKMLKQALRLKCCERVILNALHARGIYLHPLREKPVRTPEDVHDRMLSHSL